MSGRVQVPVHRQVRADHDATPLLFGKAVHATLARIFQDVIAEERTGPIDEARAQKVFGEAWAESGLVGAEVYREGLEIVRNFVRSEGVVDHRDVLAVEKEFPTPLGRFTVIGSIDRVNRVDDETLEVVDYKTNRGEVGHVQTESSSGRRRSLFEHVATHVRLEGVTAGSQPPNRLPQVLLLHMRIPLGHHQRRVPCELLDDRGRCPALEERRHEPVPERMHPPPSRTHTPLGP